MIGPVGFSVKDYDASTIEGTSVVKDTGTVIITVTDPGTIDVWLTGSKIEGDPSDGGIPVEAGDKVVITPSGGGYAIQVVK
ncbi:MAG TPA: hypothetical protein VM487_01525 [Phycisphaerae bacterium]|nr:hypothetical protein [Phycisphaerae bacterium]